jgi:uncharacterized protein (DUF3084 family)
MAKSHYSIKKRKKELARKQKQEQKRARKINKKNGTSEMHPDDTESEINPPEAQ